MAWMRGCQVPSHALFMDNLQAANVTTEPFVTVDAAPMSTQGVQSIEALPAIAAFVQTPCILFLRSRSWLVRWHMLQNPVLLHNNIRRIRFVAFTALD